MEGATDGWAPVSLSARDMGVGGICGLPTTRTGELREGLPGLPSCPVRPSVSREYRRGADARECTCICGRIVSSLRPAVDVDERAEGGLVACAEPRRPTWTLELASLLMGGLAAFPVLLDVIPKLRYLSSSAAPTLDSIDSGEGEGESPL